MLQKNLFFGRYALSAIVCFLGSGCSDDPKPVASLDVPGAFALCADQLRWALGDDQTRVDVADAVNHSRDELEAYFTWDAKLRPITMHYAWGGNRMAGGHCIVNRMRGEIVSLSVDRRDVPTMRPPGSGASR